jgi:hypothetical protein
VKIASSVVVKIILINYAKKKTYSCLGWWVITNFFWSSLSKFFPTYPFCTFPPGMNKVFFVKQNLLIYAKKKLIHAWAGGKAQNG